MFVASLSEDRDSTWRDFATSRVTLHVREHSYAASRADVELREADRAVAALQELLDPPKDGPGKIEVYLVDPVVDLRGVQPPQEERDPSASRPRVVAQGGSIIRAIGPDTPSPPPVRDIARRLIPQWFGDGAASAVRIIDGIAGVVNERLRGPSVPSPDDWVRAEIAAGRPVSVVANLQEETSEIALDEAATSFVGYLIKQFGTGSLRDVLTQYNPERRDEAVVAVYHRPLGALEETWLASLRRPSNAAGAIPAFVRRLAPLITPYRRRIVEGIIYTILSLSYTLALPLSTKYVFDTLIPRGDGRDLAVFVCLLFLVYAFNAVLTMRRVYVSGWLTQRILFDLQERMFGHLQRLSHDFYGRAKIGDIMSRLSSDLLSIQMALSQIIGVGLFLALSSIVAAITLLRLDLRLGLLVVLVVPAFAVIYFFMRKRVQAASQERQKYVGAVAAVAQENLSAHAVVKAFGLEERSIASYRSTMTTLFRATLRLSVLGALFETSVGMAVILGQVLVLGVGGYMVIQGEVTLGTLAAFIGLLTALLTPIAALSGIGQSVQMATGSIDRINDLLDEPVAVSEKPGAPPLPRWATISGWRLFRSRTTPTGQSSAT